MKLHEIVVGHTCNVVDYKLIGFSVFIRRFAFIVGSVYLVDVMAVDGGAAALAHDIIKQFFVKLFHHRSYCNVETRECNCVIVDLFVIIAF